MLEPERICCPMCGFRIQPNQRTVHVLDEIDATDVHGACAVALLLVQGVTIVVPRPVAVTA